jgi:hypothetical protein
MRTNIQPGSKPLRKLIVKTVLAIIGRSFVSTSHFDPIIKSEIASWPKDFIFVMRINPDGPSMAVVKKDGKLRYKSSADHKSADLVVSFKNMESAFLLFTARISTAQGYCEHRLGVTGDIPMAMSAIRCLNVIETYLFPHIVARAVVKRVPHIPVIRLLLGRARLYCLGIFTSI